MNDLKAKAYAMPRDVLYMVYRAKQAISAVISV